MQEMQMIPFKKELKIKGFRKKFKIPDGVVLDRIKAKYDEEDAALTIVMPKMEMAKGISGDGLEEVKEEEVVNNSVIQEAEQSAPEEVPDKTEEETAPVKKRGPKPWKPCPPLYLGGSTLLVSLIFLVIHYIRVRKH